MLCGIDLQKSNYGNIYYVNCFYCIGDYKRLMVLPNYYDSDIQGGILTMSKIHRSRRVFFDFHN